MFLCMLVIIAIFGYLLRIYLLANYNFFFTMDQGEDAVNVRNILVGHSLITHGAPTNIAGIYSGPGWYYFLAIGYWLFGGSPFGAVFMVVISSLFCILFLSYISGKFISYRFGIIISLLFQFYWFYFDTSRWAFNPFPLVWIAIALVLSFSIMLARRSFKLYPLTLLACIAAFNSEVAGAFALYLFFVVFGLYLVLRYKYPTKLYLPIALILPTLTVIPRIKETLSVLLTSVGSGTIAGLGNGVFSGTNFVYMADRFADLIARSIVPQSVVISLILFVFIAICYFSSADSNKFRKYYIYLSLTLFFVSYLWFAWNKGWRDWHTLYIPPVLFSSLLMMLSAIKRKLAILIFIPIVITQFQIFTDRYTQYLSISDDPSILANQLKVIDWVYQNSEHNGFNAYMYMSDSFYDFPYQYLFWWHGRNKYGYVPCEYANYPLSLKYLYVPGAQRYNQPTLGCEKLRFLIVERPKDPTSYRKWTDKFSEKTEIVSWEEIGTIRIEKRQKI